MDLKITLDGKIVEIRVFSIKRVLEFSKGKTIDILVFGRFLKLNWNFQNL